jgi:ATP-dependent exoDNAse (exonuclease V) beta subunit
MLNFISWCEKQQNLLTQLNEVQNLPNLKRIPDNNLILNALATVLPRLVAELNVIFTEAGKCDHTQILIQSLQATDTSNDHFSETILNLDQQIKHILIDEYQDTSASQIRLIKNLVAIMGKHR